MVVVNPKRMANYRCEEILTITCYQCCMLVLPPNIYHESSKRERERGRERPLRVEGVEGVVCLSLKNWCVMNKISRFCGWEEHATLLGKT